MQVGDQDGIDAASALPGGYGLDASEGPDAPASHGIGQDSDPVEVDDDRGVAEEIEVEPATHRQPLRAASG